MVGKFCISIAAALLTAAVMGVASGKYLETRAEYEKKKNLLILGVCALLLAGAAVLFADYGYSFWKMEKYFILLYGMIPIAMIDRKEQKIPNQILAVLCMLRLLVLLAELVTYPALWLEFVKHAATGAAGSFVLMMLAYYVAKGAIGLGDVKLVTTMGLFLGFSQNYLVLFVALLYAAGFGIVKLLRKRLGIKDTVAFGPFVAAALWTVLLLGM